MAITDQKGVWNLGLTLASVLLTGSWSSRAIPKHSRTVEVMIDMQQMKIAADTTKRYTVANADERFSSMMFWGPMALGMALATVALRSGTAIRVPHRKIAPMMSAPSRDMMTARGASRRGSLVSSASVDAVSNP